MCLCPSIQRFLEKLWGLRPAVPGFCFWRCETSQRLCPVVTSWGCHYLVTLVKQTSPSWCEIWSSWGADGAENTIITLTTQTQTTTEPLVVCVILCHGANLTPTTTSGSVGFPSTKHCQQTHFGGSVVMKSQIYHPGPSGTGQNAAPAQRLGLQAALVPPHNVVQLHDMWYDCMGHINAIRRLS